ncbi:hypothetical protein [Devosia sp. 2618]|uniref:hypothetical protein n=1 Tax=Devosia sp. 2618 TaxID=3156454 RepID=UPI003391B59E
MIDAELRAYFGLSERALQRLRMTGKFPKKDALIGKTDSKAVDHYFDQRAGLVATHLEYDREAELAKENFSSEPRAKGRPRTVRQ